MPATKTEDTPAEGRTTLNRFLRTAVYVAIVCVVGAIIAIYFALKSPSVPTGPARSAAQNFFNDLKASSYHDAYGSLCSITKQSFTQDQFVSGQQSLPAVDGYTITKVTTQRVNGSPAATVTVDFTRHGGTIEHHNVPMVQESGRWLVCGEPY
jgi:Domain of unknown function (DUF4878)